MTKQHWVTQSIKNSEFSKKTSITITRQNAGIRPASPWVWEGLYNVPGSAIAWRTSPTWTQLSLCLRDLRGRCLASTSCSASTRGLKLQMVPLFEAKGLIRHTDLLSISICHPMPLKLKGSFPEGMRAAQGLALGKVGQTKSLPVGVCQISSPRGLSVS